MRDKRRTGDDACSLGFQTSGCFPGDPKQHNRVASFTHFSQIQNDLVRIGTYKIYFRNMFKHRNSFRKRTCVLTCFGCNEPQDNRNPSLQCAHQCRSDHRPQRAHGQLTRCLSDVDRIRCILRNGACFRQYVCGCMMTSCAQVPVISGRRDYIRRLGAGRQWKAR